MSREGTLFKRRPSVNLTQHPREKPKSPLLARDVGHPSPFLSLPASSTVGYGRRRAREEGDEEGGTERRWSPRFGVAQHSPFIHPALGRPISDRSSANTAPRLSRNVSLTLSSHGTRECPSPRGPINPKIAPPCPSPASSAGERGREPVPRRRSDDLSSSHTLEQECRFGWFLNSCGSWVSLLSHVNRDHRLRLCIARSG